MEARAPLRKIQTEKWLERDDVALAGVLPRYTDVVAYRGVGSWIFDVDGNRFLDLASGIATTSTGHCNHKVVNAIVDQAYNLLHTSVVTHNIQNIRLAEEIGKRCPFFEDPQVFFCNSGAEAVDGGLKLARYTMDKAGIVAFRGAFHGRTMAATSITTANDKYRRGYAPFLPGIIQANYNCRITEIEKLFGKEWSMGNGGYPIGAIIVEPVLGEGGYIPAKASWLHELRAVCDNYDALLIFDEVQTGAGRTGSFFAAEHYGVTPDILLFAKGIASGMPLGGIIAEKSLMEHWHTGSHGSTFGGNPVSCAAALATLDVLNTELLEQVKIYGTETINRLTNYLGNRAEVRGIGYMIGIELDNNEVTENVRRYCLDHGVIVITCGPCGNVIRLAPALNIFKKDLDIGLTVLEAAFDECV